MHPDIVTAVYALLSALSYGTGDFIGGFNSRKNSLYAVIILSQIIGMILYIILALVTGEAVPPAEDFLFGIAGGLAGVIGLLALYRSLSFGSMGITAPVAGVITAAIPVMITALTQGLPDTITLIGFGVGLAAVWFIARSPDAGKVDPRGLVLPLIAGIGFGFGFVLFARATQNATFIPLIVARISSVTLLTVVILLTRKPFKVESARALPLIFLGGVLDAGGNAFFVLAANSGERIDIAAVLSSMYPAATILLAALILRERISITQWLGIVLALIAIVLIVA